MAQNEFLSSLSSNDMVVWNGVISRWGSIKSYYTEGDEVRLADQAEVQQHKAKYRAVQDQLINFAETPNAEVKTVECASCGVIHLESERRVVSLNIDASTTLCPRCSSSAFLRPLK